MTKDCACANASDVPMETVYEALLRIEKLTFAAELLADACPILQTTGAPPIEHLLSLANEELRSLQSRVSD